MHDDQESRDFRGIAEASLTSNFHSKKYVRIKEIYEQSMAKRNGTEECRNTVMTCLPSAKYHHKFK
jgi:hypothetical protein